MGQKTHPYGFRLGFNKGWLSLWYGKGQHYIDQFHTDIQIRKKIKEKYKHAGIASIEVKRIADTIRVQINTARPGILIGKGGAGIQELKKFISASHQEEPGQDLRRGAGDPQPGAGGPADRRGRGLPDPAPHLLPPRHAQGR